MQSMNKLPKPERKKRIKARNVERKGKRPPRENMTPEEFERRMTGLSMMFAGLLKFAGVDLEELIAKAQAAQTEEEKPVNNWVN